MCSLPFPPLFSCVLELNPTKNKDKKKEPWSSQAIDLETVIAFCTSHRTTQGIKKTPTL
jgi:hypothetical protein